MISILRKLPVRSPSPSLSKIMDSPTPLQGSLRRLVVLARQLRRYKAPRATSFDDFEERRIEETTGKVVSQVGFAESATPIAKNPQRFRPKKAAVLICLFEGDAGEFRVILTLRSQGLSSHSGEVSLPGGKAEEGDKDDVATAIREAQEEIGLDPSLVNIVTRLQPFLSKSQSLLGKAMQRSWSLGSHLSLQHLLRVVPVIGILTDKKAFEPVPNPSEVDVVFDVPLEMFIKDENRRVEEVKWMGDNYLIHYFQYEIKNRKYVIWGLTAGILIKAASVVYQRPPPFLEQNPNFRVRRFA